MEPSEMHKSNIRDGMKGQQNALKYTKRSITISFRIHPETLTKLTKLANKSGYKNKGINIFCRDNIESLVNILPSEPTKETVKAKATTKPKAKPKAKKTNHTGKKQLCVTDGIQRISIRDACNNTFNKKGKPLSPSPMKKRFESKLSQWKDWYFGTLGNPEYKEDEND